MGGIKQLCDTKRYDTTSFNQTNNSKTQINEVCKERGIKMKSR